MKQFFSVVCMSFLLLSHNSSFAWGKIGHSIVPQVAFTYLDENTKQIVLKYLDGMSIESAATWMDDMRSEASLSYLKPWHYVNLDKDATYQPSTEDNILNKLGDVLKQLRNAQNMKPADVKQALLYLFHLVGDLHQPLHAGYGSDIGGNNVEVSFMGTKSNLHSVWDSKIIEYKNTTAKDCMAWYNGFTKDELADYKRIDILHWFEQSRSYLPQIYKFSNATLDAAYVEANTPIVEKQLLIAGIRLASVLTEVFGTMKATDVSTGKPTAQKTKDGKLIVPVSDVASYEGKVVTVCTKVYGGKFLDRSNGEPTLLNLGANFPNSLLTVMIWGNRRKNFPKDPEVYYVGKQVCVTGRVVMYKGKPEIIIEKESEIVVQ